MNDTVQLDIEPKVTARYNSIILAPSSNQRRTRSLYAVWMFNELAVEVLGHIFHQGYGDADDTGRLKWREDSQDLHWTVRRYERSERESACM
jgi:hypothetical protein